jgi:hypothetical protein
MATKYSIPGLKDLSSAKNEWSKRLLQIPGAQAARGASAWLQTARALTSAVSADPIHNVVGVAVGEKISDGNHTGVWAVKFLVRLKFPESQLSKKHVLPKSIAGLPVDVEETGLFRRFAGKKKGGQAAVPNPQTRIRPAQPGCSIGFADPAGQMMMAGTFGALVKDRAGTYVLSNNHVLADENQLPIGSPIFQPGLLDGGNAATDKIAELTKFIPLQTGSPNHVDCAIAKLREASVANNKVLNIGAPTGTADAQIDMTVHKFGRTTSYSVGRVSSVDTDVKVQYETGTFAFTGQIIVVGLSGQPFSGAGDSGSLILERPSNKAVALLFAGSQSHTIANHIGDVLQNLGVTLV